MTTRRGGSAANHTAAAAFRYLAVGPRVESLFFPAGRAVGAWPVAVVARVAGVGCAQVRA